MQARAEGVAETRDRILEATVEAWLDVPYEQLTLDEVARRAGTTRQTVLRHFRSKPDLVVAAAEWYAPRIAASSDVAPGDVREAVESLVFRYEVMGDATTRMLEVEKLIAEVHELLERGRDHHREWVATVFGPFLPENDDARVASTHDALYAATDVAVWKLLRRDFGRSVADTTSVIERLVRGVLHQATIQEGP